MKKLPLRPLMKRETSSITPTHSSTSAVSTRLENSMAKKTVTMVTMEENTWGMLWEIICRKVSVSLV